MFNIPLQQLEILANLCQVASFDMNISQVSNDKLMKHLLEQDKILDEQTNSYLKKIVEQNEEILAILRELRGR